MPMSNYYSQVGRLAMMKEQVFLPVSLPLLML